MSTLEEFQAVLEKAKKDRPVFVMFSGSFCPPCKVIKPYFIKASKQVTEITFVIVDIVDGAEIAEEYDIRSIPAILVFIGSKIVSRMSGANKDELKKLIAKYTLQESN
jgi:thioredoxin 1